MTPTKERYRFQPLVLELEPRITPSSTRSAALALPTDVAPRDRQEPAAPALFRDTSPTASTRTVRTLGVAQLAPQAKIDFGRLPEGPGAVYKITIKLTSRAGTPYSETFTSNGIPPSQVRNAVRDSMRSGGWVVENDGDTGLTIRGHGEGAQFSPIKKVDFSEDGLKVGQGLRIFTSSGVEQGQKTTGDPWRFSFSPTPDAPTIEQDAVVRAVINGVTVDTSVTAGMTAIDVAFSVYNAMISAGITDALLLGSDIVFLNDTMGQETREAWLYFDGSASKSFPSDWLQLGITIPERIPV